MLRKPKTRPQVTQEKQLLLDALAAFEEVTATQAVILNTEVQLPEGRADAEIQLGVNPPLIAEVKQTIRPATLGNALAQLRRIPKPAILVTRYISPQLAGKLKEMDIPFLDAAGNSYLRTPDTFIYVVGRKEIKRPQERPVRAFRAKGLKVVFALLCMPDLIKAPYREIADKAGVALGTVTNIVKDLEQIGCLFRSKKKGLVLENQQKLIDQWVEAYPRELRPQLKPQRFNILHSDWWKEFDYKRWEKNNLWLGGEPAAALLTKYIYPEQVTVYGRPDFKKLARIIHPARDEDGKFELLEPFWNFEYKQLNVVHRLCPPLLVYADLVATGEARQLDAAGIIRDKYLVRG